MGGRQVGRSEPACRVASTTALPPPTCTARREAGQRRLLAAVLLQGLYRPDRLQLCFKACAGQIVRRLCLPAAALFCRLCCLQRPCSAGFVCLFTFAMPCPLPTSSVCPRSILLCPPVHFHVRQDRRRKLYGLSCWQLQHGPAVAARAPVLTFSPCRVH